MWISYCTMAAGAVAVPFAAVGAEKAALRGRGDIIPVKTPFYAYAIIAAAGAGLGFSRAYAGDGVVRILLIFLLCALMAAVCLTDIKYRLIPNRLVLATLAVGAAYLLFGGAGVRWWDALAGFLAAGVLFALPSLWGKKVGAGDIKLAAAVGLCTGATGLLSMAVIMGALLLLYFISMRQSLGLNLQSMIPMGPFIAAAFLIFLAV